MDREDPREHPDQLVLEESLDHQAHLAPQDQLGQMDHLALVVPQGNEEAEEERAQQDQMVHLDHLEIQAVGEKLVLLDHQGHLALVAHQDRVVHQDLGETEARWDLLVHPVQVDLLDQPVSTIQ